jgi:hypothetical protein
VSRRPGGDVLTAMLDVLLEAADPRAADLTAYDGRPVDFARDILGVELWDKQREVVEAVVSQRRTIVRAGHGVGKTFVLAVIALYWLYAHRGMVKSTAPTKRLTEKLLWGEIHRLRAGARVPLPAVREGLTSLVVDPAHMVEAEGFTSSKESKGTGSQGQHHARLLVIMDEAFGVHEMFWQPLLSQASGTQNRVVAVGNPTDPSAPAARYDRSGSWHRIRINCLDHPNVTEGREVIAGAVSREYIEEVRQTFGEQSATFACRVLGEYPEEDRDSVLVPRSATLACVRPRPETLDLDAAGAMEAERQAALKQPLVLGCDVGRTQDATCIAHRYGHWIERIELLRGWDTNRTSGHLAGLLRKHRGSSAAVDEGGIGAGVVDNLVAERLAVTGVQFGGSPGDEQDRRRFANGRARMLWGLRERILAGQLSLPPGDEAEMLADELAMITWRELPSGKIQIEAKDAIRERLGRSPDVSDAAALACRPDTRRPAFVVVA